MRRELYAALQRIIATTGLNNAEKAQLNLFCTLVYSLVSYDRGKCVLSAEWLEDNSNYQPFYSIATAGQNNTENAQLNLACTALRHTVERNIKVSFSWPHSTERAE